MLRLIEISDIDFKEIKHGKPISARVMDALIHSAPLPYGICGVIANGEPLPDDVKDGE